MDGLGLHAAKRELTEPEGRNEDGELAEANMLKDVEPVTQEQCVTLERLDRTGRDRYHLEIPTPHALTLREAHPVCRQLVLLVFCFRFRGASPCEVGKISAKLGAGHSNRATRITSHCARHERCMTKRSTWQAALHVPLVVAQQSP